MRVFISTPYKLQNKYQNLGIVKKKVSIFASSKISIN